MEIKCISREKKLSQWFLNISKFSEDLLNDLEKLDGWPEKVKLMQKNWIGKSYGCELNFKLENDNNFIKVFTTRQIQFLEQVLFVICRSSFK